MGQMANEFALSVETFQNSKKKLSEEWKNIFSVLESLETTNIMKNIKSYKTLYNDLLSKYTLAADVALTQVGELNKLRQANTELSVLNAKLMSACDKLTQKLTALLPPLSGQKSSVVSIPVPPSAPSPESSATEAKPAANKSKK